MTMFAADSRARVAAAARRISFEPLQHKLTFYRASHSLSNLVLALDGVTMVRSPDTLERELLRLPRSDRARLAQVLLVSLDAEAATQSPAAVEAAWEAEIARRVAELRNGTVAGIPADEVFAEVLDR